MLIHVHRWTSPDDQKKIWSLVTSVIDIDYGMVVYVYCSFQVYCRTFDDDCARVSRPALDLRHALLSSKHPRDLRRVDDDDDKTKPGHQEVGRTEYNWGGREIVDVDTVDRQRVLDRQTDRQLGRQTVSLFHVRNIKRALASTLTLVQSLAAEDWRPLQKK